MKKYVAILIFGYLIVSIAIPGVLPGFNFEKNYVHIGEYTFEGGKTTNLDGVVFMNNTSMDTGFIAQLFDAGIRAELGILSESKFSQFEELESNGQCAAAFLNSNSKMLLVIPDSAKSALLIKRLQKGDQINLRATYLYNPVRNVDDIQIPISISGAQIVLVSSSN